MIDLAAIGVENSLYAGILGAFLAGAAGSPHCVAMCGGFAVASSRTAADGAAWTLGRLTTYATLGAIAGTVGAVVPGPGWVGTALAAVMLVWFALRLGGLAPEVATGLPRGLARLARRVAGPGLPARFAFGAVNGLLPCGLVYAALAFPVAVGSPFGGAVTMVAFGLATAPALALAVTGLRRLTATSLAGRRALAGTVLVLGLAALWLRADVSPPGAWHTAADAGVCD